MRRSHLPRELVVRLSLLALFAVAILLAPATLRADTYITYTLDPGDTLADGSSISGTFTIDETTMHATANILADGMTFTTTNSAMGCPAGNCAYEGFVALGSGGSYVLLSWLQAPPFPSPLNFYSPYSFCQGCLASGYDHLGISDTATDPVPTPEPATALMLIAGFASIPFLRRRRSNA